MANSVISMTGNMHWEDDLGDEKILDYIKNRAPVGISTFRYQSSPDRPSQSALVGFGILLKPFASGAYSIVFTVVSGTCYVADQINASTTSINWHTLSRTN